MKVSWNWLSEYVDLDGLTPEEVGAKLTMAGLELDGIERLGTEFNALRVGHIQTIASHPEADKLVLCQVDFGEGAVQIVCGAKNMKAGDKVPVIPAGESLPDGTKIKRGKIRGEVSNGMLCSARELGLSEEHDGLMILDPSLETGKPLADALNLRDTVLELSVTPNRGDALSYLGIAREVAALFGRKRSYPWAHPEDGKNEGPISAVIPNGDRINSLAHISIEDSDGCSRYAAAVVENIKVAPSPEWLTRSLEAIGLRPVNNIVDVTNFVLFETGQPLHAFDLNRLNGSEGRAQVVVRRAKAGETLQSIDHVERTLLESDLVIADAAGPIAIAGVMGGADSEVADETTSVLIECAHFDPQTVRKTAKRL
ncbi:MAG: phenylalanine--tRNA ligase subunit beta, partial [Myxococcales bacterium]|nr:phenylalanine--tRNA ligase subunit beta [Myxococcales bacterium]